MSHSAHLILSTKMSPILFAQERIADKWRLRLRSSNNLSTSSKQTLRLWVPKARSFPCQLLRVLIENRMIKWHKWSNRARLCLSSLPIMVQTTFSSISLNLEGCTAKHRNRCLKRDVTSWCPLRTRLRTRTYPAVWVRKACRSTPILTKRFRWTSRKFRNVLNTWPKLTTLKLSQARTNLTWPWKIWIRPVWITWK